MQSADPVKASDAYLVEHIEAIILTDREAIRFRVAIAAVPIGIGLMLIGAALIATLPSPYDAEAIKTLVAASGTLISSIGGFPIKDILAIRGRLRHVNILKKRAANASTAEYQELESLIKDVIRKAIGGGEK